MYHKRCLCGYPTPRKKIVASFYPVTSFKTARMRDVKIEPVKQRTDTPSF